MFLRAELAIVRDRARAGYLRASSFPVVHCATGGGAKSMLDGSVRDRRGRDCVDSEREVAVEKSECCLDPELSRAEVTLLCNGLLEGGFDGTFTVIVGVEIWAGNWSSLSW